jgi:hypothetical protein
VLLPAPTAELSAYVVTAVKIMNTQSVPAHWQRMLVWMVHPLMSQGIVTVSYQQAMRLT